MNVSEIRAMEKDAKIPLFTGKIVEMKKVENKDINGKQWKEQALKVEDSTGKVIKVVLNNASVGLDAQDLVYDFKECVVNHYTFKNKEGKDTQATYLKAWKGCEVSKGTENTEKPKETQVSAVSGHSDKPSEPTKQPYYNTSESIARMNALGHAVELIKLKGTVNPLIDIVEIATPLTKWILTGEFINTQEQVDPEKSGLNPPDDTEIPF